MEYATIIQCVSAVLQPNMPDCADYVEKTSLTSEETQKTGRNCEIRVGVLSMFVE